MKTIFLARCSRRLFCPLAFLTILIFSYSVAISAPRYRVKLIGWTGITSNVYMNNHGDVVGLGAPKFNVSPILYYRDGTVAQVFSLLSPAGVVGLADDGTIGTSSTANGNAGLLSVKDGWIPIPIPEGEIIPQITLLTKAGVAYVKTADHHWIYQNGTLSPLDVNYDVVAANASGRLALQQSELLPNAVIATPVAGWISDGSVLTKINPLAGFIPPETGNADSQSVQVSGINEKGAVVGTYDAAPRHFNSFTALPSYAFVASADRVSILDGLGGFFVRTTAINNQGIIVGKADFSPVIWYGGEANLLTPLVDFSGTTYTKVADVLDINDAGQILAHVGADSATLGTELAILDPISSDDAQARIVNFSVRAPAGTGERTCILGFVTAGGSDSLLLRGIGPSLVPLGVGSAASDTKISLFNGSTLADQNDDWGLAPNLADLKQAVQSAGAFVIPDGSRDAMLLADVPVGGHSIHILDQTGNAGVVLGEVYEAGANSRLINASCRFWVESGERAGIAGFVLTGDSPRTLLIRGVGPALAPFGITSALADPRIRLYRNSELVDTNDDWGSASRMPLLASTTSKVGAFALPDDSKDAALLVTLLPGAYTVQLEGANGATGVALLEIYSVP